VAAATTPASTSPDTPTPIATIDSPIAMRTISPWRSAKWPGTIFHPSTPKNAGPLMSSRRATAQSAALAQPSTKAAAVSRPTPNAVLPASVRTE
jgi:hypothetical protein